MAGPIASVRWLSAVLLLLISPAIGQAQAPAPGRACLVPEGSLGSVVLRTLPERDCVPLRAQETITGLWLPRFEASPFFENAASLKETTGSQESVWLGLDGRTTWRKGPPRIEDDHAYRISFIGRRARDMTARPMEGYGHMGMWKGLIVVDEVLEITDLGIAR